MDSQTTFRFAIQKADERTNALLALEKMKALEKKKLKKLKALRVDERTIHYATAERMKDIKKFYKLK